MTAATSTEPLVQMAKLRLRCELEEEFRQLPFEDRLTRILALATPDGKSEAEFHIHTRAYAPHAGAPLVLGYIASAGQVHSNDGSHGNAGSMSDSPGEAIVQLGATMLALLESQADELRKTVDGIERRLRAVRGGAKSVGPLVEEEVPF